MAGWFRDEGWEVERMPISREFVHLDGLLVPLDTKLLVACLDALEPWVVASRAELRLCRCRLCRGATPWRQPHGAGQRRVLSMQGADRLNTDLASRGYEVHAPDMSMFTLGGGGVHCLAQALRREPG